MFDFISNMLKELPLDMDGMSETPAPLHLFAVDENAKVLDETTAQFSITMLQRCSFCANVLVLTSRLQLLFYVLG